MRKTIHATALLMVTIIVLIATVVPSAHAATKDPRAAQVTKGLDYLHARQQENGGFGSALYTTWSSLALAASGEQANGSAWVKSGGTPFTFLQSRSHVKAAGGYDVSNPVTYYAQAIMAYVAAGQPERVFVAGTPHIDLLAKLYAYQNQEGGAAQGSFSPSSSSPGYQAVHTTSWAILAMHAIGESKGDRFDQAIVWLSRQQRADGGFPAQESLASNVEDTAMAVQALELAGAGQIDARVIPAARAYLKARQRSDGGFPHEGNGRLDAYATAAAIQAIVAIGEDPDGPAWKVNAKTPRTALNSLRQASGAFKRYERETSAPIPTTCWALIAYRKQSFTKFPRSRPATLKPFAPRPAITSATPRSGTRVRSNSPITLRASYNDGALGTGVDPRLSRILVDGSNRSKSARVTNSGVTLRLSGLKAGVHTWKVEVTDYAGNTRTITRTLTVTSPPAPAPPAPAPAPDSPSDPDPVIPPDDPTPLPDPTPPEDPATPYPTPTSTLFPDSPYPSPAITGILVPSPSVSPGAGISEGRGGGVGFIGGTLLAMLPVGAALGYLALGRRIQALGQASEGEVLPGDESTWEHVKAVLRKTKNLLRREKS